ncbi:uncharacterized protein LOC132902084 [Amyelois transitella]|uniref:uncharacterized protein LOC132902084 n=1 Tax=Amyelois transitella TaxID=680683 RepID=UPI00299072DD|nr:uncharacterized protein LOC132902084 [Amyelois transitella]
MPMRWSEEETKKLINLYKKYPFLWDSSDKMYTQTRARKLAYEQIIRGMNKPNLTIKDIRCKVKNLRTAYYQDLKKKSTFESLGKKYKSNLPWFTSLHGIMEVINKNKMTLQRETTEAEEEYESDDDDSIQIQSENDTLVVSIKQEFLDQMENREVSYCPIVSQYLEPIEVTDEPVKKKKKVNKRETIREDIDEFQSFVNSMAEQLRNMPLDKALNLQVEVQALIAKERIDALKNSEDDDEELVEFSTLILLVRCRRILTNFNKMAPNWTPQRLQQLFALLSENYEGLFDSSSTNSHRKLNKNTIKKIAEQLNISVDDLRHKYFNINNAYNTEVKKIEAAKKQGFFYRPTLHWFNEYKEVMEKFESIKRKGNDYLPVSKEVVSASDNMKEMEDSPQGESIESEQELFLEDEDTSTSDQPISDTIVVSIKQECIDAVKKNNWDVDFEEPKSVEPIDQLEFIPPPKPRKIAYVKKNMSKTRKLDSPLKGATDEFQMFADHIAEQLRNMTIDSARKMQSEIHIIFDEEGFPFYSPILDDM